MPSTKYQLCRSRFENFVSISKRLATTMVKKSGPKGSLVCTHDWLLKYVWFKCNDCVVSSKKVTKGALLGKALATSSKSLLLFTKRKTFFVNQSAILGKFLFW